jgi:exopolyphosphatase/guanosine-5'-triphosphate,3'-diphosphate pyrophosphatase
MVASVEHIGGWRRGRFAHTYAAIDLGTNNCRLLVARASATGFDVIDAFSRPVRLGEGIGDRELLCRDAIGRTLDAHRDRSLPPRRQRRGFSVRRA